ncbi:hypothetical protein ACTA71_004349 [Dictyostelium dimigraforme]
MSQKPSLVEDQAGPIKGILFPSLSLIKEYSPEIIMYEDYNIMVERFIALAMDKRRDSTPLAFLTVISLVIPFQFTRFYHPNRTKEAFFYGISDIIRALDDAKREVAEIYNITPLDIQIIG